MARGCAPSLVIVLAAILSNIPASSPMLMVLTAKSMTCSCIGLIICPKTFLATIVPFCFGSAEAFCPSISMRAKAATILETVKNTVNNFLRLIPKHYSVGWQHNT